MKLVVGIFFAVLSTIVLPVPEEATLVGAGWLAHEGRVPAWAAFLAAFLAISIGDVLSYVLGRVFLQRLLHSRLGRKLLPDRMRQWAERLVCRHGARAVVLARFLVALRGPVYFAIGEVRYPFGRFLAINSAVGAVEIAMMMALGYGGGALAHKAAWINAVIGGLLALALVGSVLLRRAVVRERRAA